MSTVQQKEHAADFEAMGTLRAERDALAAAGVMKTDRGGYKVTEVML